MVLSWSSPVSSAKTLEAAQLGVEDQVRRELEHMLATFPPVAP